MKKDTDLNRLKNVDLSGLKNSIGEPVTTNFPTIEDAKKALESEKITMKFIEELSKISSEISYEQIKEMTKHLIDTSDGNDVIDMTGQGKTKG